MPPRPSGPQLHPKRAAGRMGSLSVLPSIQDAKPNSSSTAAHPFTRARAPRRKPLKLGDAMTKSVQKQFPAMLEREQGRVANYDSRVHRRQQVVCQQENSHDAWLKKKREAARQEELTLNQAERNVAATRQAARKALKETPGRAKPSGRQTYDDWLATKESKAAESKLLQLAFGVDEFQRATRKMCKNDTTFELMNGLAYEIAKMDVEHCVHPMEIEYLWGQARVQLMLTAKINQRKRIDRMSKSQAAEKDEDEVLDEVLYPVRDMSEDQRKLILRILAFSEAQQSESPRAQIGQGSKPPKESSRTKFGNTMHTMRQFFEAIDADDNDDIDPQEFNTLCQRLGLGIDEATAYELFTAFDTDNSGGISYSEFEQSMVDVKADNYYEERRPLPALSQKVQLACGIIEEEGEANAFKLLISVFREALETRLLERTIPRVVTLDELRAFVVNENVDLSALTQIERQNLVNIMERMFFAFMDRPDNKAKVGRVLAADEPLAQDNRQRIKHDMVLWYLRKVLIRLRNDGNVGTFMTGSGAGAGAGAHRDRGGHVVHGERGHGHGHSEGYDMFTEEDDGVFNDSELAFTVGVTLLEKFGLNNKQRRSSMAAAAVKRASVSTRNGNSNASKQRGSQTLGHDRECNYTSRKLHAFERYASRDVVDGKSATQRLLRIDGLDQLVKQLDLRFYGWELEDAFDAIDTNKDGVIDQKEWLAFIENVRERIEHSITRAKEEERLAALPKNGESLVKHMVTHVSDDIEVMEPIIKAIVNAFRRKDAKAKRKRRFRKRADVPAGQVERTKEEDKPYTDGQSMMCSMMQSMTDMMSMASMMTDVTGAQLDFPM